MKHFISTLILTYWISNAQMIVETDILARIWNISQLLKILSCHQVGWLEFLFQINLIICFYLRYLEFKLDTITHREDFYPRKGKVTYNSINLQNMCLIFTHNQLKHFFELQPQSFQNFGLLSLLTSIAYIVIQSAIMQNETLQKYLYHLVEHWLLETVRLLLKNEKIYILQKDNLCMHILQYYHDYILAGYFRQNKTLKLIFCSYTWLFPILQMSKNSEFLYYLHKVQTTVL